jgi:hypothetical protein
MSTTWLADAESAESADYDDTESGEFDEGESENYDAESRASAARRRLERQRRIALRQRQELARTRRMPPTPRYGSAPAPPSTVAALRTLDLETKVQEDSFRNAIAVQNRRMRRSEYAAVASAATSQFIESFDEPDNPYFRAGLRFAPLLLLSPQKRGTGLGSVASDPRVLGAAAVLAITFAGQNRDRFLGRRGISLLSPPGPISAGERRTFMADAVDGGGKALKDSVTWESSNEEIAKVEPKEGNLVYVTAGNVTQTEYPVITASSGGVVKRVMLEVKPDSSSSAQSSKSA